MTGQTVKGLHKGFYTLSRELGRGGEGTVYEVQNNFSIVVKIYNDPLTAVKEIKLRYMATVGMQNIQHYAAWPSDIIIDQAGRVTGFTMRRLAGYFPLHMLFSPMDRKKLFPEKGYNFLAHVAKNLAAAFYKLHEAGIVIGDVNEGNMLVDARGLVAFIDCDSFQVQQGNNFHFCDVGVPRYTPPELLDKGTFDQIVRTPNTDSFSLAILIFQLLFLGRHPFAGRNTSKRDIDEATAIQNHLFAYSLKNKSKELLPPADSFPIGNLPTGLIELFHTAFEQRTNRPLPGDWIKALDALIRDMITCNKTVLHTYPNNNRECPWCFFKETRGIVYFLDDSYHRGTKLLSDINGFVNGFKVEQLQLSKYNIHYIGLPLRPNPIEKKFDDLRKQQRKVYFSVVVLGLLLCYFTLWLLPGTLLVLLFIRLFSSARHAFRQELTRREEEINKLKNNFELLTKAHDSPPEVTQYQKSIGQFEKLIASFRDLPQLLESRKRKMEEGMYEEQLHHFLANFELKDHQIPSFGGIKKQLLFSKNITTASDISKLTTVRIVGVGPKSIQVLIAWQRQMAAQFIYRPNTASQASCYSQIANDIAGIKSQLEADIRKQYQSLHLLKNNITNKQQIIETQLRAINTRLQQAQLDYQAFKQFCS